MSKEAIRCESLTKRYSDKLAVDALDLVVPQGICQGLLGPNGAGKTTTVEMMEGLSQPSQGRVMLFGQGWGTGDDQSLRLRIGVQLQETVLADKLHVDEVIRLFRSFYPSGRDVDEILDLLSLRSCRHQQYCRLSGGQKQRVAVATALVGEPELLFLDEPTTGLDPRARQALWDVVRDFRARGGTVVLTTHYMEEAAALCDEIAILDSGRIIAEGSPRALVERLGDIQELSFDLEPPHQLQALASPGVRKLTNSGNHYRLILDRSLGTLTEVLTELLHRGVVPVGLATHQPTLDDVFLELTGKQLCVESAPDEAP